MPYESVSDLPSSQVSKYGPKQKEAFLKAFNNASYKEGRDESSAFAIAHSAAKKADGGDDESEEVSKQERPSLGA